jgi:hypothetical protein
MNPHESERRGPVFHVYTVKSAYIPKSRQSSGCLTVTSSKLSKSLQRLGHSKGASMPRPNPPTQYAISTIRDSSSRSAKRAEETVRLVVAWWLANGICAGVFVAHAAAVNKHATRFAIQLRRIVVGWMELHILARSDDNNLRVDAMRLTLWCDSASGDDSEPES